MQFEMPMPSAMNIVQLDRDADNKLVPVKGTLRAIDWSASGGVMNTCAGSTTPWSTHLGSEENFIVGGGINARDFAGTFAGTVTTAQGFNSISLNNVAMSMRYFGIYPAQLTNALVLQNLDPYKYGFITEVAVKSPTAYTGAPARACYLPLPLHARADAQSAAVKHYAMGRAAWELSYVMPDQKTAYGGVDTDNGGFYKFVANTAGDLSSGSLYCARMQSTGTNMNFGVSWVLMSTTSDATIKSFLFDSTNPSNMAGQLTFDDIFLMDLPTGNVTGACNAGYTSVNTAYQYTVNGVKYYNECLQLNPANPNAAVQAATLETQRYAGYLGCTTEFNKWEGITFRCAHRSLADSACVVCIYSRHTPLSPSARAASSCSRPFRGGPPPTA